LLLGFDNIRLPSNNRALLHPLDYSVKDGTPRSNEFAGSCIV